MCDKSTALCDTDNQRTHQLSNILPYQVWPSDYQSDLDNRCVWSRYKNEGCEQHEYSLWRHLFTDCSVEVTLRSNCLGRLNQLWIGQGGGGFWTHSTYTGYPDSAGSRQLDRWRCLSNYIITSHTSIHRNIPGRAHCHSCQWARSELGSRSRFLLRRLRTDQSQSGCSEVDPDDWEMCSQAAFSPSVAHTLLPLISPEQQVIWEIQP